MEQPRQTEQTASLDVSGLNLDPEATQGMLDDLGPSDYFDETLIESYEGRANV